MRLSRAMKLLAAGMMFTLALTSAPSQSHRNSEDFAAFLLRFRAALDKQDKSSLKRMMDSHFDFFTTENVAPDTVMKALAANDGLQWTNVRQAIDGSPINAMYGNPPRPSRSYWCAPAQSIYNCYLVFQLDETSHWRWKAMVMPHRY